MIQEIVDTLYRKPRSNWNLWQRFGGYFEYQKMLSAQKDMEKAAESLYIKNEHNLLPELNVCFLTGKKFWYQTLFCAYSLQKITPNPIHFTFYDDGTLDQVSNIKGQIPNSTFLEIPSCPHPWEQVPYQTLAAHMRSFFG